MQIVKNRTEGNRHEVKQLVRASPKIKERAAGVPLGKPRGTGHLALRDKAEDGHETRTVFA
jgi:hypothetical protein